MKEHKTRRTRLALRLAAAIALAGITWSSHANVVLGGTRVIFDGNKRETSIAAKNNTSGPYVIQAWVEKSDPNSTERVPFLVTPPLSRLDGGKESLLRILRNGDGLPKDRESVFWLNVKEIPPKAKEENVLQLAVRSRIKLFYRPAGLAGKPYDAPKQLQWSFVNDKDGRVSLKVTNPSAYHVTLGSLKATGQGVAEDLKASMISPHGEAVYALKSTVKPASVTFTTVNDYGGETDPISATVS